MLKYPQRISIERLENYLGEGQFADVNMQSFLKAKTSKDAVKLSMYSVPNLARIPFKEAMKGNYEPVTVGVRYGPTWSTHWFRLDITVPPNFAGSRVTLIFDPDCEAMVWSEKGETMMGITGGGGGNRHVDFDLLEKAEGGERIKLYIEVASNGLFGEGQVTMIGPTDPNRYFSLKAAELVIFNDLALSLYWDLDVLLGIVKEMPADSQLQNDALFCANQVINTIHAGNNESLSKAKAISSEFFEKRKRNGAFSSHQITAIGNCHIDTAWLWPYDETKRKIARSWSTQLRFLEQFPDYTFAASQMQQFEWLEQLYPELFQRIVAVAKQKRFIPIGGTWVEMDCNIPSGEAFCRQFLYGQNYLKEKFGMRSSVFWLPDTFGYSSQLPQIVKSAGLDYFFTQKLSWNNINKFPHTSFYWKGLDGTSVLTHFSPADTYTAQASVKDAVFMVKNNKDKLYSNKSLLLYGNGDGGGGPLRPMMERIKRFGSVEGMPADVKFGNPELFYKELETTSTDLNTWQGELYFELHRGTYTSHGLIKKYNRKCELLLREVEILWSMAIARGLAASYPTTELDRLWKLQLLNQFHDVLPGSSINLVYVDATRFYEDITVSALKLKADALSFLVDTKGGSALNLFNPTGWIRKNVVLQIPSGDVSKFEQASFDRKAGLLYVESLDPFSFTSIQDLASMKRNSANVKVTVDEIPHYCPTDDDDFIIVESVDKKFVVENGIIKVVFDAHGRIEKYFDVKNQREIIPAGELANVFRFYEDIPLFWDAWDVEVYHLEKGWDAGVGVAEIIEEGPLRVVLRVVHKISKTSTLEQRIEISTGSDQIVFDNDIFWDENRKILKVQFPVSISNDNATFETQYGVLQRPTHANNSWDMAKFEVCAHKFVDLSEYGYGVALLNDCKYGFSVRGNVMSMSILRAPKAPDDKCDIGRHTFKYALQPHLGTFAESNIVQMGYEFNCPVSPSFGQLRGGGSAFVCCDKPNFVIDTVKRAESGNGWVIRFYESYGGRGKARIVCSNNLASATLSNVLEEAGTPLALNSRKNGRGSLRV